MRYSSDHKKRTREKLLDSSRSVAKKSGFDSTGVDALMSAIGMTGGAFYAHFATKAELLAAIVEREMDNSAQMLAGDDQSAPDHIARCIRSYLSNHHALHPETGCVLPALGSEITRAPPEVRATVESSLKKMHGRWRDRLDGDSDRAWGLLAECVGALLLSRVVESERTRQEILASSRRFVERIPADGKAKRQKDARSQNGAPE